MRTIVRRAADHSSGALLFARPTSITAILWACDPVIATRRCSIKLCDPCRWSVANLGVIQGSAHGGPPLSHADVDEPVLDLSKGEDETRRSTGIRNNVCLFVSVRSARVSGCIRSCPVTRWAHIRVSERNPIYLLVRPRLTAGTKENKTPTHRNAFNDALALYYSHRTDPPPPAPSPFPTPVHPS